MPVPMSERLHCANQVFLRVGDGSANGALSRQDTAGSCTHLYPKLYPTMPESHRKAPKARLRSPRKSLILRVGCSDRMIRKPTLYPSELQPPLINILQRKTQGLNPRCRSTLFTIRRRLV